MKIAGGKELIYREGETATIFAEVPSEPAANEIRDCAHKNALNIYLLKSEKRFTKDFKSMHWQCL